MSSQQRGRGIMGVGVVLIVGIYYQVPQSTDVWTSPQLDSKIIYQTANKWNKSWVQHILQQLTCILVHQSINKFCSEENGFYFVYARILKPTIKWPLWELVGHGTGGIMKSHVFMYIKNSYAQKNGWGEVLFTAAAILMLKRTVG